MSTPQKTADADHPIHALLAERWSPLAFADRPVDVTTMAQLFEAARWAASCFNEQPWRFFVARREERALFERLAGCLVEANRAWAAAAPVLALSVARLDFSRNGKPNRHAWHDVGLAVGNLTVQAQHLGLRVHQMGGFDVDQARATLGVPAGFDPVAMIAIGFPGDPAALPEALRERELAPRSRRPLSELVFGDGWGTSHAAARGG